MKMISVKNAKKLICELENIFYTLNLDDATWGKFDEITDLYFGCNLRNILEDDITEEIAIVWHIEDVQSIRPDLNDHQASEVLKRVDKNHDANIGVSWETLEIVADMLFPIESTENANFLAEIPNESI